MEQTLTQVKVMDKGKLIKYSIAGIAVLGVGYFLFFHKDKDGNTVFKKSSEFISNKGMTREMALDVIEKFSGKKSTAEGYDTDYLIARAKALKSKSETFSLDGKVYSAKTGKVIR